MNTQQMICLASTKAFIDEEQVHDSTPLAIAWACI